jgi:hypothetical protein
MMLHRYPFSGQNILILPQFCRALKVFAASPHEFLLKLIEKAGQANA